jgi:RHH-type rel operon transcriptional repressor/antitoxin RelB
MGNEYIEYMYSQEGAMPTTIRLSPEVEERLNALAAKTGRSKSYYLREFIERGLEDLEDFYDAEAVMERYRRGQERTYTLDEIRAELGLDDRAA